MHFRQRKGQIDTVYPEDERPATGASATLSNVGPDRAGAPEHLDMDTISGTSSGLSSQRRGLRGKPSHGSREDMRL